MRLSLLLFVLLVSSSASAQGTGTIAGQVLEDDGVTTVIGGNVRVEGTTLGAVTDIDGNYRIIGVPAGIYSVTASFFGADPQTASGIEIGAGETRNLGFALSIDLDALLENGVQICFFGPPLITNDVYSPRILTGWDIEQMPLNR